MKRLLKIALYFLIPLCGVAVTLYMLTSSNWNLYQPKLPKHKRQLIIGNSHPECSLIETDTCTFVNLGKSGECFYYSVRKADWIISNNPQIKEVWIEIAANQLMPHMNQWIHDVDYEQRTLLSFPFLMETNWEWGAWYQAPSASMQTKLVQARRYLGAILRPQWTADRDLLKWGNYREMKGRSAKFESPDKVEQSTAFQPDIENWNALLSFCERMQQLGIEVHVFQSPEFERADGYRKMVEFCSTQKLPVDEYHDILFDIHDTTLFYDASHLNSRGAQVFTTAFVNQLAH